MGLQKIFDFLTGRNREKEVDLYNQYWNKIRENNAAGLPIPDTKNPDQATVNNVLGIVPSKKMGLGQIIDDLFYNIAQKIDPVKKPISDDNGLDSIRNIISPTPTFVPFITPTPTLSPKPTWDELKTFFATKAYENGYSPAAIVGQKANESARGTSDFAINRNNFGGIGAYDEDPNQAFYFENPEEYWNYYDLMIRKRFPNAYKVRNNPIEYLKELKKANYATSPTYVEDIMGTPEFREFSE